MMKTTYKISTIAACALLLGACSDDDKINFPDGEGIVIELPSTLDLGGTYASFASIYHLNTDARYTKAGYVIGETENPTIYGSVYEGTVSGDTIKVTITDLAPAREFHIRA